MNAAVAFVVSASIAGGLLGRIVRTFRLAWCRTDPVRIAAVLDATACACGHQPEQHWTEDGVTCCTPCGSNTHCDYADLQTISADRFDEGYIAAVEHLAPKQESGLHRLLWAVEHMPRDNPYREESS